MRILFVTLCLLALVRPQVSEGQQVLGKVRPACGSCVVGMKYVATVSGDSLFGGVSPTPRLARLSNGRFFHSNYSDLGKVFYSDAAGRLLRSIGRRGSGPGEYRRVRASAVGANDSVYVVDWENARVSVLSPEMSLAREFKTTIRINSLAALPDGRFLVNAEDRTPARVGFPLHFAASDGAILKSFGGDGGFAPELAGPAMIRIPWVTGRGAWVAPATAYRLEFWNLQGILERTITRQVDWFRPYTTVSAPTPNAPPPARVSDIMVDARGWIWVLLSVPAPDAGKYIVPTPTPLSTVRRTYRVTRVDGLWDTILEIIDPAAGTLVLSKRYKNFFLGFADAEHIYDYAEDEDGRGQYRVWRVELTPPAGSPP